MLFRFVDLSAGQLIQTLDTMWQKMNIRKIIKINSNRLIICLILILSTLYIVRRVLMFTSGYYYQLPSSVNGFVFWPNIHEQWIIALIMSILAFTSIRQIKIYGFNKKTFHRIAVAFFIFLNISVINIFFYTQFSDPVKRMGGSIIPVLEKKFVGIEEGHPLRPKFSEMLAREKYYEYGEISHVINEFGDTVQYIPDKETIDLRNTYLLIKKFSNTTLRQVYIFSILLISVLIIGYTTQKNVVASNKSFHIDH